MMMQAGEFTWYIYLFNKGSQELNSIYHIQRQFFRYVELSLVGPGGISSFK